MAIQVAELEAVLTADTTRFDRSIGRARDELGRFVATKPKVNLEADASGVKRGAEEARGALRGVEEGARAARGTLQGLLGANLVQSGLGAIFDVAKSAVVDFNVQIQTAQAAFTSMAQAAAAAQGRIIDVGEASRVAQQHLDELKQFAVSTPFELTDLTRASQRLQAFGFDAKAVIPILRAVGDQASALGSGAAGVDRIVTALGQIQVKGRVQGEELLQLTEAGIPALQALATHYGKTTAEMQDLVSKGMVPANEAIAALLTDMERRVPGMMDNISSQLPTALSNIKDAINQGLGGAFKPLFDLLQEQVAGLAQALGSDQVKGAFAALGEGVRTVVEAIRPFAGQITAAVAAFTAGAGVVTAFGLALSGIGAVIAAVSAPVAALAVAVGALAAAFATDFLGIRTAVTEVGRGLLDFVGAIQRVAEALRFEDMEALGEALAGIRGALRGVVGGLAELLNGAQQALAGLGAIVDALGGLLTGRLSFDEFFAQFMVGFEAVKAGAQGLLDGLAGTLHGLIGWGREMADGLLAAVQEWVPILWQWVGDALPGLLAALGGMRDALVTWIVDTAGSLLAGLMDWAAAFVDWVTPLVPDILNALTDGLGAIVGWIVEQAPVFAQNLLGWAQAFAEWVGPASLRLLEALGRLLGAVMAWLREEGLPRLRDQLGHWVGAFVAWVPEAAQAVAAALPGIGEAIRDYLAELAPRVQSWATGVAGAILEGLKSGFGRIGDLFGKLGEAIALALRGQFDEAKAALGSAVELAGGLAADVATAAGLLPAPAAPTVGRGPGAGGRAPGDAAPAERRPFDMAELLRGLFPGGGAGEAAPATGGGAATAGRPAGAFGQLFGATGALAPGRESERGKREKDSVEAFWDTVFGFVRQLQGAVRDQGLRTREQQRQFLAGALALIERQSGFDASLFVEGKVGLFGLSEEDLRARGLEPTLLRDPTRNIEQALRQFRQTRARTAEEMAAVLGTVDTTDLDAAVETWSRWIDQLGLLDEKGKRLGEMGDPLQHGVELIGRGVEALKRLSTDYLAGDTRAVAPFFDDLSAIVEAMVRAADRAYEQLNASRGIEDFVVVAEHAVGLLGDGVEALGKLGELELPAPEVLTAFLDTVSGLVDEVVRRSEGVGETMVPAAEAFVAVAGDAYALLAAGADVLGKLGEIDLPDETAISAFFDRIDAILDEYTARLAASGEDLQAESVAFLRLAADALGTVTRGAEALRAIFSTPPVDADQIARFVGAIEALVDALAEAAGRVERDAVRAAGRFGRGVEEATRGIKVAADGLNALLTLQPVRPELVERFVAGVRLVVERFAAEFGGLGSGSVRTRLLDGARRFGELAGQVTGPLASGVEGLNRLWTLHRVSTADVERFVAGVVAVAQRFAAAEPAVLALSESAKRFAATAGAVVGPIASGVEAFNRLGLLEPPDSAALATLRDALAEAVGLFAAVGDGSLEGFLGAGRFAESARSAADAIGAGLQAFAGLGRFVEPAAAGLDGITRALAAAVGRFGAVDLEGEVVARATRFADGAKAVAEALVGGLKTLEELRYYRERDLDVRPVVAALALLAAAFREEGAAFAPRDLERVKAFAGALGAVAAAFKTGLEALNAVADTLVPSTRAVGAAFGALAGLLGEARRAAASLDLAELERLSGFGQALGSLVGAFRTGVEALTALATSLPPSGGQLRAFVGAFLALVGDLQRLAGAWEQADVNLRQLGEAGDALGRLVAPVEKAVGALGALVEFEPPDAGAIRALVDGLVETTRDVLERLVPALGALPAGGDRLLGTAGTLVTLMGQAAGALAQLADLRVPDPARVRATLGVALGLVVDEATPLVARLAATPLVGYDRAVGVLDGVAGLLGRAAESLAKLAELRPIDGAQIARVFEGVTVAVGEFGALLESLRVTERQAAQAERIGPIVGLLGSAIDPLVKLRGYLSPSPFAIRQVAEDIRRVTQELARALEAVEVAAGLEARLGAAERAVQTVGTAVEAILKLAQLYTTTSGIGGTSLQVLQTPQRVIDSVVATIRAVTQGIEAALNELGFGDADTAGVKQRLDRLNDFTRMVQGVVGAVGGLGGLRVPEASGGGVRWLQVTVRELVRTLDEAAAALGEEQVARIGGIAGAVGSLFQQFAQLSATVTSLRGNQLFEATNTLVGAFRALLADLAGIGEHADLARAVEAVRDVLTGLLGLFTGDAGYSAGLTFARRIADGIQAGLGDLGRAADALAGTLLGHGGGAIPVGSGIAAGAGATGWTALGVEVGGAFVDGLDERLTAGARETLAGLAGVVAAGATGAGWADAGARAGEAFVDALSAKLEAGLATIERLMERFGQGTAAGVGQRPAGTGSGGGYRPGATGAFGVGGAFTLPQGLSEGAGGFLVGDLAGAIASGNADLGQITRPQGLNAGSFNPITAFTNQNAVFAQAFGLEALSTDELRALLIQRFGGWANLTPLQRETILTAARPALIGSLVSLLLQTQSGFYSRPMGLGSDNPLGVEPVVTGAASVVGAANAGVFGQGRAAGGIAMPGVKRAVLDYVGDSWEPEPIVPLSRFPELARQAGFLSVEEALMRLGLETGAAGAGRGGGELPPIYVTVKVGERELQDILIEYERRRILTQM